MNLHREPLVKTLESLILELNQYADDLDRRANELRTLGFLHVFRPLEAVTLTTPRGRTISVEAASANERLAGTKLLDLSQDSRDQAAEYRAQAAELSGKLSSQKTNLATP